MNESNGNGKALRFASLVRVSTEKQEQKGESLRTQRQGNIRDVERLSGTIAGWYGGQEHATAGWEKKEVDRLISDASKDKFDAVIVTYADRWSRDNTKSEEGLEAFRQNGIRFYVSSMEMNLFNPEHCLILGMNAVIGKFLANQSRKKSIESKIARAKRNIPSAGSLPFGRTFDRNGEKWGIDPTKRQMIADIASRYLAGESMSALAKEYGINHSFLCSVFRKHCGTLWTVKFDDDALNIHETVTLSIPELLPRSTVRDVLARFSSRRTHNRVGKRQVNDYLLGGHIFCAGCGYSLTGAADKYGIRHYRHTQHERMGPDCTVDPKPWVKAEDIERQVVKELFTMFGNPSAIERAVKSAIPDCEAALQRQQRLQGEIDGIEKGRERIVNLIVKGLLTEDQAAKQLGELKERELTLKQELERIDATLSDIPDEETIRCYVDRVGDSIFVYDDDGEGGYAGGNDMGTWIWLWDKDNPRGEADRRALIRAVFDAPLADGSPAGVYVSPEEGTKAYQRNKKWTFKIRGRLEFEYATKCSGQLPSTSSSILSAPAFLLDATT